MVSKVIVTVLYERNEFDMEFPANVNIKRLRPLIIKAFLYKGWYLKEEFKVLNNSSVLKDSDTLLDAGIWDGSYIVVE